MAYFCNFMKLIQIITADSNIFIVFANRFYHCSLNTSKEFFAIILGLYIFIY
jgi:hypothetical protein